MQHSFMNRSLVSTTAVALAMAWAVVALSQAQPQEVPGVGLNQALPEPQLSQPAPRAESQNLSRELAPDPAPVQPDKKSARDDKQLALRKPCHEMDDREMDGTCGGITGSFDITGAGNMTLNDNSSQSIALSGQAQQNLTSLVNILSINSTISVMMNLNVNINSTVGTVNQGNTGTQNMGVQNNGVQNTVTP